MTLTYGLGAGRLQGTRRTYLVSEYEDCKGWSMFGCSPESTIMIREYATDTFSTLSFNPLLSSDFRISSHLSLGIWGQVFYNSRQSLGTVAFVFKIST